MARDPVNLSQLLLAHLIRWFLWIVILVCCYYLSTKAFSKETLKNNYFRGSFIIATTALAILSISLQSIISQGIDLSPAIISELYLFFLFQKGLAFSFASLILFLQIDAVKKSKKLKDANREIYELKETIKSGTEQVHHIQIKTGFKLQKINIQDIVWIQAEDYCSRVHTSTSSFVIRKSLKAFENELDGFRFIRVHRGALLNLSYLDQINLLKSTVRLKTKAEIPASKLGIRVLREELEEKSA